MLTIMGWSETAENQRRTVSEVGSRTRVGIVALMKRASGGLRAARSSSALTVKGLSPKIVRHSRSNSARGSSIWKVAS